jgi:serine/threonine-protein kinase HipA
VVCTDIYPILDGRMALKLNKSKVFPVPEELIAYGERMGLKRAESEAIMARISEAFDTVTQHFEQDARYKTDDLLDRIRAAVRRSGIEVVGRLRRPGLNRS